MDKEETKRLTRGQKEIVANYYYVLKYLFAAKEYLPEKKWPLIASGVIKYMIRINNTFEGMIECWEEADTKTKLREEIENLEDNLYDQIQACENSLNELSKAEIKIEEQELKIEEQQGEIDFLEDKIRDLKEEIREKDFEISRLEEIAYNSTDQ